MTKTISKKKSSKRDLLSLENRAQGWVGYGLRKIEIVDMVPDVHQIETSSVCNLRCVFCPYEDSTRKKEFMNLSQFRKFMREQAPHVNWVGLHHMGEPLLNPQLPQYIRICNELGIHSTISTNATRMSARLADRIIQAGLARLIFSLDGVTPETYEKLRRRGKYEEVVSNIQLFLSRKKKAGKGPLVQIQFIETPENRHEWEEFRKLWEKQPGVDQLVRRSELTYGGQRVRHDEYKEVREKRYPCLYLWRSVAILADGRVVPCCFDGLGKEVLGNVFKGDSLKEIWNGHRMKELRRLHVEGKFDEIPLCSGCKDSPGHARQSEEKALQSFMAAEAFSKKVQLEAKVFEKRRKWKAEF